MIDEDEEDEEVDEYEKDKEDENIFKWYKKKKLYFNISNFVMKSKFPEIAKEVKRSNSWWRFACGDVVD